MYAIVRAGAKQQKVAVGDVIEIDQVATAVGESVKLPVVMLVDGEKVTATGLDKASVTAEVLGGTRIRRDKLDEGVADLVDRVLAITQAA